MPSLPEQAFKNDNITYDENLQWRYAFDFIAKSEHPDHDEPFKRTNPQSAITCSKSTIETVEQGVKYVQS